MTDMKYGWRGEFSPAASNARRNNNLYGLARPAALFGAPDKWVNIRNVADGQKASPSQPAAGSKAINANDKSA